MSFDLKRHWNGAVCRAIAGSSAVLFSLNACAPPPKPVQPVTAAAKTIPIATAEVLLAPEPPMPRLEQVALLATEVPGVVEFKHTGRALDSAFEILQFSGPREFSAVNGQHNEIHLDGAAQPYAFVSQDFELQRQPETRLWVRRPDLTCPLAPPRSSQSYT